MVALVWLRFHGDSETLDACLIHVIITSTVRFVMAEHVDNPPTGGGPWAVVVWSGSRDVVFLSFFSAAKTSLESSGSPGALPRMWRA